MPKKTQKNSTSSLEELDAQGLIVKLFKDYSDKGLLLPPLETTRWNELILAILTTYSQPSMHENTVDLISDTFANTNLLDLQTLAVSEPLDNKAFQRDSTLITLSTIMERCGMSPGNARKAIVAICEAASVLQKKYQNKVQLLLRNQGSILLNNIAKEFAFSNSKEAHEFLTIWLQRTLNMPIPAITKTTAAASKSLGVPYESLVEAADSANLHIGILDEVLRAYLHEERIATSAKQAAGENRQ